jgi:signal transduction histidine kinase
MGWRSGTGITETGQRSIREAPPAGQSEIALNSAFERYAVWVRCWIVGMSGLFAMFTVPPGYAPRMAAVMALVIAWCCARLSWLQAPPPVWQSVTLEAVVLPVLGLSQGWTGTRTVDGWALAIASITALTYQVEWTARPLVALMLAFTGLGSYVGGLALVAPPREVSTAVMLASRVLGECLMWRGFYVLTKRQARAADAVIEQAAASRRAASVAEHRRQAEREYLATLHDTASATLLAASMGAPGFDRERLAERARRDLDALNSAREGSSREVDLAALLGTLSDQYDVRLRLDLRGPVRMPASAGLAVFRGVREGLLNVERHAQVDEAELLAHRDESGRSVVELRDRGKGFDPARIPAQRRGIDSSIIGRMSSTGGSVSVDSRPGEGTTVRWVWSDAPA